jgi:CheY-like chemotaxis protein
MSTNQTTPRTYTISARPENAKRMSVLILDDNTKLTTTLKENLEDQGYRTTIVPSGTEGIVEILKNDFDAIVCDMVMPNFPGDMFYSAVQQSRPHLCQRFIFITGHQSNPKIAEFILQTGCPALWKPFETRQLFEALETVTGRSS